MKQFNKNLLLALFSLLIIQSTGWSQTETSTFPVLSDAGGFGNSPFGYPSFSYFFSSSIVTKDELNAAGINGKSVITALQVQHAGIALSNRTFDNQFIFMRHIGATDQFSSNVNPIPNPANPPSDFIKTFQGSITYGGYQSGWKQIDFNQNSFIWNGTDNIELVVINNGGGISTSLFFVGSSTAFPPYAVNRICFGGSTSLPASGTLATAGYLKRFIFTPTSNQESNTTDCIGFSPRANGKEIVLLVKDPSTTPLTLSTSIFKSTDCSSNQVEFAWSDSDGNWWNGTSFTSSSPVYNQTYSSITLTAGNYGIGQYAAFARCPLPNAGCVSSGNAVGVYLLNGNVFQEDFGSGASQSLANPSTYNGWNNSGGTAILLDCPGEFTNRGYKINSGSTVCSPTNVNYGSRSLSKEVILSGFTNYTLSFETSGGGIGYADPNLFNPGYVASVKLSGNSVSGSINADYPWTPAATERVASIYRTKQLGLNYSGTQTLEFISGPNAFGKPFKLDNIRITGWPQANSIFFWGITPNQTVDCGDEVTIQVFAMNAISYKWFRNNVEIPGANSSSYTFTATPGDDQASFTCEVTNSEGTVTSDPSVVTVNGQNLTQVSVTPPDIQNITVGNTGNQVAVAETGGGTISSRQWGWRSVSGGTITPIAGASGPNYTPSTADINNNTPGTYYLVCTSVPSCGSSLASNEITIVIKSDCGPKGGSIAGLSSVCSGAQNIPYTYSGGTPQANQWNWSVPSGASITAGQGTASITVNWGTASSGNIICKPGKDGCDGDDVTLNVAVKASPAAPTGSTPQVFCAANNPKVNNLSATGSNITWYSSATGGSPLASNTSLANGGHYFASQTVDGCESKNRLDVTVTINPSASTQAFIGNSTTTTNNAAIVTIGGGANRCNRSSTIYTKAILNQAGGFPSSGNQQITSIGWTAASTTTISGTLKIYMENTAATATATTDDWSTQIINNATLVYNGFVTLNNVKDQATIVYLPNAFVWNNSSNLRVAIEFLATSSTLVSWYRTSGGNTAISANFNSSCPANLSNGSNSYYPNTTFSTPRITVSPETLSGFTYNQGSGPSSSQTYTISSSSLFCSGDVTITAPANYEISIDNTNFSGSLLIPYVDGSITGQPKTIYVRLKAGLPSGTYNSELISNTGNGASTVFVTLNGTVTGCTNPTIPTISSNQPLGSDPCQGGSLTLSIASGSLNDATNWQWYTQSCGGTLVGSGTSINISPETSTTYFVRGEGGCVIPASCASFLVNIIPTPSAPTGNSTQNFCDGNNPTVANLAATGNNIQWYSAANGGSPLSGSTALVNGNKYYASQSTGNCESTGRLEVTVSLNASPNTPTSNATQSFCSQDNPTVANLSATGNNIQWYSEANGGSPLSGSTALVNGNKYYASQSTGNCESTGRLEVTVSINASPNTPTGNATQSFCSQDNPTVANLSATGNNIQWYSEANGGSPLPGSTALVNGNKYYASQSTGNCESTGRLEVTVSLNASPNTPTGNATQLFCSQDNPTVANLAAIGNNIQWYSAANGGSPLSGSTALVNGNKYYASQSTGNCESTGRLEVTVSLNTSPNTPTGNATQSFCSQDNPTVANLSATGNNIQWYSEANGGSPLSGSTALVNGNKYYASQSTENCESTGRLEVTVSLNTSPNTPTGNATQSFCSQDNPTVANLSATGNNIQWYSEANGGLPLPGSTALVNGTNYYASQTSNGCESSSRLSVLASVTACSNDKVWNGSISTAWDIPGNWTPIGVPVATDNLTIPDVANDPVLSTNGFANNISILAGATMTINTSFVLFINGNFSANNNIISGEGTALFKGNTGQTITGATTWPKLQINNAAGLTVASGAQTISLALNLQKGTFTTNGNVTLASNAVNTGLVDDFSAGFTGNISGVVTVKRFFGGTKRYRYISSPINSSAGLDVTAFSKDITGVNGYVYNPFAAPPPGIFPTCYIYQENDANAVEATSAGIGWISKTTGAIETMRGYAAVLNSQTISLTGPVNTGTFSMPITFTPSANVLADGYNLIGNPYPSPISWNAIRAVASNSGQFTATVRRWSSSSNYFGQYADWNGVVGTNGANDNIALGQAFFIKSLPGSNSITLENSVRRSIPGALFFEEAPETMANNLIRFKISSAQGADEAVVYFDDAASDRFDPDFDAPKMLASQAGLPNIYTRCADGNLSINVLGKFDSDREIPLDVVVTASGMHKLEMTELNNFDSFADIYLEDRNNGTFQNLHDVAELSINLEKGTYAERFFIHLKKDNPTGIQKSESDLFSISPNPASDIVQIKLRQGFVPDLIQLFDVTGRLVDTFNSTSFSVDHLPGGLYHVAVSGKQGRVVKPLIIGN